MDIILNGSKWIGFEPTDQGFEDLVQVSGQPETEVKNAWGAAMLNGRTSAIKAECRRRIYAAASAETQMNMATAGAFISSKTASARSEEEKAVLTGIEASLAWVAQMRENVATLAAAPELDISDDANWPECPDAALAVVGMF